MKIIQKTWNEFWGEFLLVTFHKDNPDKWESVKKKAEWVNNAAGLNAGEKVLDLGCGNGLMDICLADFGANVTAVDRIKTVIKSARAEAGKRKVKFIHGDIKKATYHEKTFDCVLILETIGLMSIKDDTLLLEKSYKFLKHKGKLIVDCPKPEFAAPNKWSKNFSDGTLIFETSYNRKKSMQTIIPKFVKENEMIELCDPYNNEIESHKGVMRYLYPLNELKSMFENIGFKVSETDHYWGNNYYVLIGEKN